MIATALAVVPPARAAGSVMFNTAGVSDKPQSKLWHMNGSWWAVLNNNNSKLAIYKLTGTTWAHKRDLQNAVVPSLQGGTCDVKWDGTQLFVATFASNAFKIYKLSYDATLDNFTVVTGFPVTVSISGLGAETIVLDKDSTGRLWVAYEVAQRVYVSYSTSADHRTWASSPFAVSGTVDADDIATVVAFGGNKIGVLWSNQRDSQVCFRVHRDTDPPTTWLTTEIARSGFGVTDDHLNVKADSQGRVFFVAKDYFDSVWVGRRDPNGTWTVTTGASGLDCGTRPILQIDEVGNKLHIFYTRWAACVSTGTHAIEERVTYLDNLLFSLPTVVISATGIQMNEAQGSKQVLPEGSLAIICQGSDGKAYWTGWGPTSGIGGSDPGGIFPPPPLAPTAISARTVVENPATSSLLWRLDAGTGTTLADASGNGRNGTLGPGAAAPVWVPGIVSTGLFFDGDDYVSVSGSGLAFSGAFTLECWFRVDLTNSPGTGAFFSKSDAIHSTYQLTLFDSEFEFGWSVDDLTDTSVKAIVFVRDGAWHHVAAVYDGNQGRIYVDGIHRASKSMIRSGFSTSWPVIVGGQFYAGMVDKTFSGAIDLVSITNTAKYSSNFDPPMLYPTARTHYPKVSWTAPTSPAGIAGYLLQRASNGGDFTAVNTVPTPNRWFANIGAPDGFLDYMVHAVDGLTQPGADGSTSLAFENNPPGIPAAPLNLAASFSDVAAEGPAWWEFDEGTGSTSVDGSDLLHSARLGDAASGDPREPTWVWGKSGRGLHFDGGDDYVEVADALDLRFTSSFTVEAWFKRGTLGNTQAMISKDAGSSNRNYILQFRSDNTLEFTWVRTSGSTQRVTSSATVAETVNWHHVAGVYNAALGVNRLYLDGVQVGSSSASGTMYTGTQPVHIGCRASSSGSPSDRFTGDLDLVRLTNFARYTAGFTPPQTFLGVARREVVHVTWSLPATGFVEDYRVYRRLLPSGTNTLVGTVPFSTTPVYVDANVVQGSTYRYTIRARNSNSVEGTASAPLDVGVLATDVGDEIASPLPAGLRLRVAPNPFNPQSVVFFRIERSGPVDLVVFDARGRVVNVLVRGDYPAGEHRVPLVAKGSTDRLASGVYFVRLRADDGEFISRAILVK